MSYSMPKVDIYKQLYTLAVKHFDVDPRNIVDDLITYHLKIKPEKITRLGLTKLLDWLEITTYLVVADSKKAKSFTQKARKLAGNK